MFFLARQDTSLPTAPVLGDASSVLQEQVPEMLVGTDAAAGTIGEEVKWQCADLNKNLSCSGSLLGAGVTWRMTVTASVFWRPTVCQQTLSTFCFASFNSLNIPVRLVGTNAIPFYR